MSKLNGPHSAILLPWPKPRRIEATTEKETWPGCIGHECSSEQLALHVQDPVTQANLLPLRQRKTKKSPRAVKGLVEWPPPSPNTHVPRPEP